MAAVHGGNGAMPGVLVVDDEAEARALITQILGGRYLVEGVESAAQARALLERRHFELVLCAVNMAGGSGADLAEWVLEARPEMAVVMVTSNDDPVLAERLFNQGVYGYLVKPYRHGDLLISVAGALRRRALEHEAHTYQLGLERTLASSINATDRINNLLKRSEERLERSRLETAHRLSLAVERRDQVTGEHIQRLSVYCELVAGALGLDQDVCERIGPAALMHDVGKIAVPDGILLKRGPLTAGERTEIERHAEIGRDMLSGSESPLLQLAEEIAWTHHEKIDGTGYPRGLVGEEIPLPGRIAAVADVFDALTRDRPYRNAIAREDALAVLEDGRGVHFDPDVLDAFVASLPVNAALGVGGPPQT